MKRRVLFTEKARNDVDQAYLWYESKGEHLGLEFIERIDEVVEQISNNPMLFAPLIGNVRRVLLEQFPYALFYRVEDDAIVIACLHHKRDTAVSVKRSLEEPEL